MKTKILEANVILKNKNFSLINTSMDIQIDWDVLLVKEEYKVKLVFVCDSVYGKFSYKETFKNYSKESIYSFNTATDNQKWDISFAMEELNLIQPERIIIDFDTEKIKIFL